jgi:cytochrome d ubiquinol oxidase subunit I
MVAIGMALIGLTLLACFFWWRGTLFDKKWLLWVFVWAVALPQMANQFGWFAAEMGRQPWVVYGHLRTSDAFSRVVTANQILFSLIGFMLIYLLLAVLFFYVLNKKIKKGPYDESDIDNRPLQEGIEQVIGG